MKIDPNAKVFAIDYANFRDEVKRKESRWAQKAYEEAGGIFSWIGKDDEKIWDEYVQQRENAQECDATKPQ